MLSHDSRDISSSIRLATGIVVVAVHVLSIVTISLIITVSSSSSSDSGSTLDRKSTLTRSGDRQKANLLTWPA